MGKVRLPFFLLLLCHELRCGESSNNPLDFTSTPFVNPDSYNGSLLLSKLEQVFGPNFLGTKLGNKDTSSNREGEFEIVEDEYIPDATTSLPFNSSETIFPILIPNEMDIVTEMGDSVIGEDEGDVNIESQSVNKTKGRISTSGYFHRNCGDNVESCGEGKRPPFINYGRNPHYCRCDKGTCDKYGDCCWTIAVTLLYRNPFRCQRIQHEDSWALMISKCSEEYKSHPTADPGIIKSCENPGTLPSSEYLYLHDLPVISNSSLGKILYRNVYCSQCNGLLSRDLLRTRIHVKCSRPFNSSQEKDKFTGLAKYQRGRRIWTKMEEEIKDKANTINTNVSSTSCGLFVSELEPNNLSWTLPDIRYCRKNMVDKCPRDFAKKNPLTAALCNSYTQIVESRPGFIFKNPHCAECYGLDSKWDLRCLKDTGPGDGMISILGKIPQRKITPGAAGATLDSTGLNLLFDFDLNLDGNYVGYEATCPPDMIWDFLRQKCTEPMCAKDHELDEDDGKCKRKVQEEIKVANSTNSTVPVQLDNNSTKLYQGRAMPGSKDENDETISYPVSSEDDGGAELFLNESDNSPSCYVLIIHQSEYTLLPNNSAIVNVSTSQIPTILDPGEYQVWNETSISICARDLSSSFRQRFPSILNYLSLAAIGLSAFFSLLHIILFFILPKMRNLPGNNLFCLTLSLLISQVLFLSFITSKIPTVCVTAAILMHYFFLSSFFWMNVMSFDIWRTFSTTNKIVGRNSSKGRTLFLKYSLWGWGPSLLIVGAAVSIDLIFEESFPFRRIRPLYGHNNLCWISQGLALFTFFALPTVILIFMNILLFALTAKSMLGQTKDSRRALGNKENSRTSSPSADAEVRRMKLYMKLGVIMGVTWILGFLSGIWEWVGLWYPFVLVNGLQGTFIFFGFDVKPKVWNMLRERFNTSQGEKNTNTRGEISSTSRNTTNTANINTNSSVSNNRRTSSSIVIN